jgi:translation initiation factor IF-1
MAAQKAKDTVPATVIEALPDALFRLEIEKESREILAYLSGKMRLHRIRVLVGDKVMVEIDPYGGKGRIVQRT